MENDWSREEARPIPLVWEGSLFERHSFSQVNRELGLALLRQAGLELTLVNSDRPRFDPLGVPRFAPLVAALSSSKPSGTWEGKRIWVRHKFNPLRIPPPKAEWVIYLPWEFSRVPNVVVEIMHRAREVWTTSHYARNSFVDSGVPEEKVKVIPNGYNPDIYRPDGPRAELPTQKPFRFLFLGGTIWRKGIDILLKAYGQAFTAADPVSLVIKDFGTDEFYFGQTKGDLIREFSQAPGHPELVHLTDYMTNFEIAALYRSCDVFVSSYRGEGFCLPALEAMACGLPVMVTKGGSTDDFVPPEAGWFIPAAWKSVGHTVVDLPVDGEAFMLDPDVDALTALLREAFQNESVRRAKAEAASRLVPAWTWERAAEKVAARCGEMARD